MVMKFWKWMRSVRERMHSRKKSLIASRSLRADNKHRASFMLFPLSKLCWEHQHLRCLGTSENTKTYKVGKHNLYTGKSRSINKSRNYRDGRISSQNIKIMMQICFICWYREIKGLKMEFLEKQQLRKVKQRTSVIRG